MIQMMAWAVILAAALPQSAEEKPKYPPYTVLVTAKTKRSGWRESYLQFQERVKKTMPEAKLIGREVSPDDQAGFEVWLFEMTAESKFDTANYTRLFGEARMGKIELEITGKASQDPKTKAVFVTSLGDAVKVKLMNRQKKDANDIVEDKVGQVTANMAEGRKQFIVRGEVAIVGKTLSIILESIRPVELEAPPPKDEK